MTASTDTLLQAAYAGSADTVRKLLDDGVSPDDFDEYGEFALLVASFAGQTNIVRILLRSGADPNLVSHESYGSRVPHSEDVDALSVAAAFGHLEITQLLLSAGARVNSEHAGRFDPLIGACTGGFDDIVRLLLDAGARVNKAQGPAHVTPLMEAARTGRINIVGELLRRGADPHASTSNQQTAADIAAEIGHRHIEKLLRRADMPAE